MLQGTTIATAIYPDVQRVVESFAGSFLPFQISEARRCTAIFNKVVEGTEVLVQNSPETIQKAIHTLDTQVRVSLATLMQGKESAMEPLTTSTVLEVVALRVCFWLAQPHRLTNYLMTFDLKKYRSLIETSHQDLRLAIRVMTSGIVAASVRNLDNDWRNQNMLMGKPGREKRRLVYGIAEALGATLIEVASEMTGADDLTGEVEKWSVVKRPGTPDKLKAKGMLTDLVREHGHMNPILFMDKSSTQGFYTMSWSTAGLRKLFDTTRGRGGEEGLDNLDHTSLFVATNDKEEGFEPALLDSVNRYQIEDGETQVEAQIIEERLKTVGIKRKAPEPESKPEPQSLPWKTEDGSIKSELLMEVLQATISTLETYKTEIAEKHSAEGGRRLIRVLMRTFDFVWFEKVLAGDAAHEVPAEEVRAVIAWPYIVFEDSCLNLFDTITFIWENQPTVSFVVSAALTLKYK